MHLATSTLFGLGAVTSLFTPASAFWRMPCGAPTVVERADPIVNPGGVSGHVHTIMGGNAFDFTMDYAQTQTSTCTSCMVQKDLSNYWVPTLYFKNADGSFTSVNQVGGATVYYLQRPGYNGEPLLAFPEGFRMLAGDPFKRNNTNDEIAAAINFVCLGGPGGQTSGFPSNDCPQGLRAQVFFPSCWNGELDSPDHKSHMAYPVDANGNPQPANYNGGFCPPTHPKHLVSIFYEVIWSVHDFADQWPGSQWPFVLSTGDPTGYGYHGDFVNGWDVDYLQSAVNTCNNNSGRMEDCPVFTGGLNSGTQMNSCITPKKISEQTQGTLDALPGCNPIQPGPAYATKVTTCAPTASIGPPQQFYKDVTASKGWAYQGCAIDNYYSRSLTGYSTSGPSMTIESCIDTCTKKGFTLAGMEYSDECYCGNSIASDRAPTPGVIGHCQMTCAGDSTEFCGDSGALSLYKKCTGSTCVNLPQGPSGGSSPTSTSDSSAPTSASSSAPSSSVSTSVASSSSLASSKPSSLSTSVGSAKTSSAAVGTPASSSAPSSKPTAPGTANLPYGFAYVGCYVDVLRPVRSFPQGTNVGKPMTNDACITTCLTQGFQFAGTEYAGQCYCSHTLSATKASESDCSMACAGNLNQICGGPARLSVFSKGGATSKNRRSMRIQRYEETPL